MTSPAYDTIGTIARMLTHFTVKAEIADGNHEVKHLLTDSRSLLFPESTLFLAIATARADGHDYIRRLYDAGVRAFVVERLPGDKASMPDASFIVVNSTLAALQHLGAERRHETQSADVVAVTGSQGKTTVKEMLCQLLRKDFRICRSPRSYNSQIGVPLSLWGIAPDDDLVIIEAGVSQKGEMRNLAAMIRPDTGIFTGITDEHSDGFASPEEKLREKMSLFEGCGALVVDTDAFGRFVPATAGEVIGWSRKDTAAPLYVVQQVVNPVLDSTTVTYSWRGGEAEAVTLPFTGQGEVEDAICCLAFMLHTGYDHATVALRMASLAPVDTRLDVMEGTGGSMLIVDRFTPDVSSLPSALDFMSRRMTPGRRATVILSDLVADRRTTDIYAAAAEMLARMDVDEVIGIGSDISANADRFARWADNAAFYPSAEAFAAGCDPTRFADRLILVKGPVSAGFDLVADRLEARRHETVLEVNLDAVADNFNWFRSRLRPSTGIICMVKASGYGAGDIEIAKTLQTRGAAYVAVAVVDEGVALREAGITMPIMVMNPRVANFRTMFEHRLEPEVYSFGLLSDLLDAARRLGVRDFPIHLKIDTGMHRLGFLLEELDGIAAMLHAPGNMGLLRPATVFSHLAVADCPPEDDYTREQFGYFDRATLRLAELLPEFDIKRHILNSTGIVRFPEHQFDFVRLGIGLYGISTMDDGSQEGLRPVSALYSSVIAVREWPAGTTVGYGRYGRLDRPSRIATIPVGYADGIDRHLGRGAMKVWIRGRRCPTVGNICMDACMVDVTEVPECRPGDRVEIFGKHIPAAELAETLGTIPYEILTSVSDRVKRIYYRE